MSSQELQAIKGFVDANDVLLIGTSSTAPSLSIPGDNIFRLVTDDVLQGKITAELLAQENISAVVPISRGDLWGDELLNATAESFVAKGGTAVEGVRYETNLTDYSSKIEVLSARVEEASRRYGPEKVAVYLVSFDEAVPIMALASNDPVLSSVRWFGSDGMAELPALVENESAAALAARSKLIAPVFSYDDSNRLFAKVSKDIQDEVGSTPDAYAVLAYDAFWIAALTELLADDGNASQEKTAFVQIANLFSGATGETKLNDAGDREFANYSLLSVKEINGTYAWKRVGFFSTDYTTGWDFERMD